MAIERQHRPIDKEFEEADYSGILDISARKLRLFPNIGDDVYDPLEIFTAVVSGNRFDKFPKQLLRCENLVSLNLHNNSLRSIPEEIIRYCELKELYISRNFIQALPASIVSMGKLTLLAANNNRLTDLPSDIGKMKSLKNLDVSCNDLVDLPSSIVDMLSLTHLNIRRNEIRTLPDGLHKVPLSFLDVSANMLTRLPPSLRYLNTLTVFHCQDNPLEWPPAQTCIRGINHVFKFLQEIEKYGGDQVSMGRDESLLRKRNKIKKASRPISDASTLSGSGSDFGERSFVDEMTNLVQSAFGSDGMSLSTGAAPRGGNALKYYSNYSYEERSPYRNVKMKEEQLARYNYRSQSPGPSGRNSQQQQQQQPAVNSSQSGSHYGTLPRTNRGGGGGAEVTIETEEVSYRRSTVASTSAHNRISSPVFPDRVLRAHSSEPNSSSSDRDKLYPPGKPVDYIPQGSSTPDHHHSRHHYDSSEEKEDDRGGGDRPNTPPSREGSVTPTPEDLDQEEPSTPKEAKSQYPRPKLEEMTQELGSISDLEGLASSLGVSIEEPSSCHDLFQKWLEDNPTYTWSEVLVALNKMGESSLALEIDKKYKLSSFDLQAANTSTASCNTPQHQSAGKQVSFSVNVSEIPRDTIPSLSSEDDISEGRDQSLSPSVTSDDVAVEDMEGEPPPSPLSPISPTHSEKPKGPEPPPKPKTKDTSTTWPRQKGQGGPQKRKKDVFKVIGKQDPNFTVRRQQANMQQEMEKIQSVKKDIEELLGTKLADDLGESISDGVLLCHLVNKLHPSTISTIHEPKGTEPLSAPKQTMNVAAFLAACKKLGVEETIVCSAGEILEYKDPVRVTGCIRGLLDTVSV
ncbi:PREDICTED: leucine-rich repeat and calponin homology domain-containing protein 1-like [Amphimedon queenslandica]|nr:PREDICTED: leucine-rich repeat and calponin homology domain-containing protein 1-like [Amphimedon queenslandica]|eukprot:XP_011403198.2 PREDICTED: leucine-rich repeat and calponin homology domain-containing protein 1-like [Amphimedon queenslandica]